MIDRPGLDRLVRMANAFSADAHLLLSRHETSQSRIIILEDSYKRLASLTLRQDDLLRQALRCVESELFRAAHVMAWAAFIDYFEERLASDGMARLLSARPNWKYKSIEDVRENESEFELIKVGQAIGLCSKSQMKALHGLLNKRNECAHPSDYYPGLNDTLGFISEVLTRIEMLQTKVI